MCVVASCGCFMVCLILLDVKLWCRRVCCFVVVCCCCCLPGCVSGFGLLFVMFVVAFFVFVVVSSGTCMVLSPLLLLGYSASFVVVAFVLFVVGLSLCFMCCLIFAGLGVFFAWLVVVL